LSFALPSCCSLHSPFDCLAQRLAPAFQSSRSPSFKMRAPGLLAIGAALAPLAAAGKSPVPPSYGFDKAVKFTLNEVCLLPYPFRWFRWPLSINPQHSPHPDPLPRLHPSSTPRNTPHQPLTDYPPYSKTTSLPASPPTSTPPSRTPSALSASAPPSSSSTRPSSTTWATAAARRPNATPTSNG
jgi:hypothetical protein